MWIWLVLWFQSNVADVFHCFFFTRNYSHETNRKQVSTPHSFHAEIPPHPSSQTMSDSNSSAKLNPPSWEQWKEGLQGLWVSHYYCSQPYKRNAELGCLVFVIDSIWGRNCLSSQGFMYILTILNYPDNGGFCVRNVRAWADEQKTLWKAQSDPKPWALCQRLVIPSTGALCPQAIAFLSWEALRKHPCQR